MRGTLYARNQPRFLHLQFIIFFDQDASSQADLDILTAPILSLLLSVHSRNISGWVPSWGRWRRVAPLCRRPGLGILLVYRTVYGYKPEIDCQFCVIDSAGFGSDVTSPQIAPLARFRYNTQVFALCIIQPIKFFHMVAEVTLVGTPGSLIIAQKLAAHK